MSPHHLHYPVPVLEDGEALLLLSQLGQLAEALLLVEVEEMKEGKTAVCDLLPARTRGVPALLVLGSSQALLDVSGAHGDVDPVPGIIVLRKPQIHRSGLLPGLSLV